MIIECPECGTKNTTDEPIQPGKVYRCGNCREVITFLETDDPQGGTISAPSKNSVYQTSSVISEAKRAHSWSEILSPDGRSSRIEYVLTVVAGSVINWILYYFLFASALYYAWGSLIFFFLSLFISYIIIVAGIRRLHDLNNSGWYLLLMFVPFVNLALLLFMLLAPGKKEANRWT